jgi:hypothetical protein
VLKISGIALNSYGARLHPAAKALNGRDMKQSIIQKFLKRQESEKWQMYQSNFRYCRKLSRACNGTHGTLPEPSTNKVAGHSSTARVTIEHERTWNEQENE